MRWKMGSYSLKYNPKSSNKNWSGQERTVTTITGHTSNPNLHFDKSHDFTIDIYDKPTYINGDYKITGSYISITEKRSNERLFLLKNNGTFDVKTKGGSSIGTYTITAGATTLPSGGVKPISLVHYNTELFFLYKEASQITVLVSDENGVGIRKYIYINGGSDPDILSVESISWDGASSLVLLNPYGKIYKANISDGKSLAMSHTLSDFDYNKLLGLKLYGSPIFLNKESQVFIILLRNKKDLVVYNSYLEIVSVSETNLFNVIDVSYSSYSKEFHLIISNRVYQLTPNLCRLDLEIIKNIFKEGQVTIYDEIGIPSLLNLRSIKINRNKSMHEARYEVQITADIAYHNQGFNNQWQK